jgi:predicted SprT family Zn-dependent metalloprotease
MRLSQARKLARQLMNQHQLFNWKLKFDNAKRRFGQCLYNRKTLSFSQILIKLNTQDKVKNTILHEIAHALIGNNEGHGRVWKNKALSIGCTATRCSQNVITPKSKYVYQCNNCKDTFDYHRKKRSKSACAACCNKHNNGKYSSSFILTLKETTK